MTNRSGKYFSIKDCFGDTVPCYIKNIHKSIKQLSKQNTYLNINCRLAAYYNTSSQHCMDDEDGVIQMYLNLLIHDSQLSKAKRSFEWIKKIINHKFFLLQMQDRMHEYYFSYFPSELFVWFLDACYHDKYIDTADILDILLKNFYYEFDNITTALMIIVQYKIDICQNNAFFILNLLTKYDALPYQFNMSNSCRDRFALCLQQIFSKGDPQKCLFDMKIGVKLNDFCEDLLLKNEKTLINIIIRKCEFWTPEKTYPSYFIIRIFADPIDV